MVKLIIPCRHETENIPPYEEVSDHFPLTKEEIKELLYMAASDTENDQLFYQVLDRLCKGIKGVVCPRDSFNSEEGQRETQVVELFVTHQKEGGTEDLVRQFDSILNW